MFIWDISRFINDKNQLNWWQRNTDSAISRMFNDNAIMSKLIEIYPTWHKNKHCATVTYAFSAHLFRLTVWKIELKENKLGIHFK